MLGCRVVLDRKSAPLTFSRQLAASAGVRVSVLAPPAAGLLSLAQHIQLR